MSKNNGNIKLLDFHEVSTSVQVFSPHGTEHISIPSAKLVF